MGRSILITGAGGFVGSAVARRMTRWADAGAASWDGEPIERVCALLRPGSSDRRLETIRQSAALAIERADLADIAGLKDVLRRLKPKAVLHLAFDRSGFEKQSDAKWRVRHLAPVEAMFEVLSRSQGTRFVHTGSAWVLASGERLAEDAPLSLQLEYAKAKAKLDDALPELQRSYGVPFVNLRLFNIFGRYESVHRLLPHLVERWRQGLPARLTHGDQVRDFNDVDDIADAYRLALLCPPEGCRLYHIGSARGVSVRQFAELVRSAMDAPGEIEFDSARTRDQNTPFLVSDPGLAMRMLGWTPDDDLEARVRSAVDWWLARPVQSESAA